MKVRGSRSFSLSWWVLIAAFLLDFSGETCSARDESTKCTSSCGEIHNISYPFRLKHDPSHCGDARYTLSCENNITGLDIPSSGKYHVLAINYPNRTIRLLDPGLQKNNCSSMPQKFGHFQSVRFTNGGASYEYGNDTSAMVYLKCVDPVNSSLYMDTAPCLHTSDTSVIQQKTYSYVTFDSSPMDLEEGCSAEWMVLVHLDYIDNSSYKSLHSALMYGFDLRVYYPGEIPLECSLLWNYDSCFPHSISGFFRLVWSWLSTDLLWSLLFNFWLARLLFGAPFVIAFLIYTWRRRHLSMYTTIEDFLQSDANFLPIRYSYREIKKMTSKFKHKLGEGGYGSVFKGKLRSGHLVAIKILDKPKGNGQDFTSEVATIGRIHHVNVVRLVGYCVEGSHRALVYDFMPNGSLDKYIFSKEESVALSCNRMYEISLGVATGIEYLHQGCDMQILHFDIKPHNILLDENFNAKISDFGLAKLYPVDNSIVTMTAIRGTMGYMAPELFYKNIGGVSYKADVYSFGMLLMEMASRRKNLNALAEHSSQIYFPLWAHDRYNEGKDLEMGNVAEEEKVIIQKMVVTALWCVQMKPSDRPSMKKAIEMLEGDVELLQMPPKPSLIPQEITPAENDVGGNSNPASSFGEITFKFVS